MKNKILRSVTIKTVDNVENCIKENGVVTPTQIGKNLKLEYASVKSALNYLNNNGKIEEISNGTTTLVRLKQNAN